jgi:hypothetical protein
MPRRTGALFVARDTMAVPMDGVPVVIRKGEVVEEGDPILVGRRELFEPFEPKVRNYAGRVEQATAAPGEIRS